VCQYILTLTTGDIYKACKSNKGCEFVDKAGIVKGPRELGGGCCVDN